MTSINYIFSSAIFIISGIVIIYVFGLPAAEVTEGFGPGLFPLVISILMMVLSMSIIIQTFMDKRKHDDNNKADFKMMVLPVLILGLVIVYSIFFNIIGFIISTVIFLFVCMLILQTKMLKSIILSIVLTVAVYMMFTQILGVPLP
ncbi:MAG TPA: tripartite tricarboxylate transporter TctB family protein [Virgibacillus sp.]|nr:tripartite tricarboxylate transporter TctB family protein [Virgibacillus sp.]HLR65994.1 tripartite tricarboxylate transporter TctB family protein [Virgibacillus sp.]